MTDATSSTLIGVDTESFTSRLGTRIPELSQGCSDRWIARSNGTLDVMGGIAEYTGGLTLSIPTEDVVLVAAFPRDDQSLRIVTLGGAGSDGNGHKDELEWPLARFYGEDGAVARSGAVRELCGEIGCSVKLAVLSIVYGLLDGSLVSHMGGGFTIVVESGIRGDVDSRQIASVQAATLDVLLQALKQEMAISQRAVICRRAQNMIVGCPVGISTHAAPLFGQPGCLLPVTCRPFEVSEPLALPESVTFVGIDCGARHATANDKYIHARTTTLMGREIIRRLIANNNGGANWQGYLASVSISDYVDHFRDKLPTKLKGSLFLERFGELEDEFAAISASSVYKVRSRAEHHIYEDDRVRQFVERLTRANRIGDEKAVVEAGELMYASHWSYGQRCGLGSIETDLLVNLIRAQGLEKGIYGARISGSGAGGTVVVMLKNTAEAFQAVESAMSAYNEKTNRVATLQKAAGNGSGGAGSERCI